MNSWQDNFSLYHFKLWLAPRWRGKQMRWEIDLKFGELYLLVASMWVIILQIGKGRGDGRLKDTKVSWTEGCWSVWKLSQVEVRVKEENAFFSPRYLAGGINEEWQGVKFVGNLEGRLIGPSKRFFMLVTSLHRVGIGQNRNHLASWLIICCPLSLSPVREKSSFVSFQAQVKRKNEQGNISPVFEWHCHETRR